MVSEAFLPSGLFIDTRAAAIGKLRPPFPQRIKTQLEFTRFVEANDNASAVPDG